MRMYQILYEAMSYDQALSIFDRFGAPPDKAGYHKLVRQFHPDINPGRDTTQQMAMINAAFDVLKQGSRVQQQPRYSSAGGGNPHWRGGDPFSRGRGRTEREDPRARSPETPEWAWAGYSGGMPPNAHIYRNNFTDVNFIKKSMWELSGKSKQQYTIWGYDGAYFRGVTTVFGSPKIFHYMAQAMFDWQTKGGNPYRCRAVFVQKGKQKPIYLIYCDNTFFDPPIEMAHGSFNANPGNDQQFMRRLPQMLDEIMASGDPKGRSNFGLS